MRFLIRSLPGIILLPLLLAAPAHASAPELRIATTDLPPLAVEGSRARPGALVEVVRELTRRAGIDGRIDFVPWKRAQFMAGHFPQTAVFPLTRTPERERQYQWLVQLYHERIVFMAEKGRQPSADPQALKRGRIALLRGSAQEKVLRDQGYRVVPTVTVAEGLRFVHDGMADAIYGDQDIVASVARGLYPQAEYHVSAPLQSTTTWLGGSPDISAAAAARLRDAMQAMQADGSYARILRKYELSAGP